MRRKHFIPFVLIPCLMVLIAGVACEKEIDISVPVTEQKLVVEGSIEPNSPPIILLTRSVGYFEPTDLSTLNNLFVHDADVKVNNGNTEVTLTELCASDLPDSLLPLVTALTGISEEDLATIDYCIYTTFDQSIWGEIGKSYSLSIEAEGHSITSNTTLNQPLPLDSLWYRVFPGEDSLGFLWARLDDPAGQFNGYRWLAQRINRYPDGEIKDPTFIPPQTSVFDDQFFDGLEFDFAYDRGVSPNSNKEDDNNIERGFFKTGDTVVVKFSTIDQAIFEFFRQMETQQFTNGNPFAAPTSVPTNIEGGLGVWAGYGVAYDTVVCVE